MPSPPPPDPYLRLWFKELAQFQTACINNDAGKLSPLNFANATIGTYLKSAANQNDFLVKIADSTGFDDLQISDLTTYKTFGALLNAEDPIETNLFNALRAISIPSLRKTQSVPYYATPVATAFPGKSADDPWTTAMSLLMASMDSTCFTLAFRIAANATVDKDGSTMGVLIKQIAGLG